MTTWIICREISLFHPTTHSLITFEGKFINLISSSRQCLRLNQKYLPALHGLKDSSSPLVRVHKFSFRLSAQCKKYFLLLRLSVAHTATNVPLKKIVFYFCLLIRIHKIFSADRERFGSVEVSVANGTDVGRETDTLDSWLMRVAISVNH